MRRGYYADRYFANSRLILSALASEGYRYRWGEPARHRSAGSVLNVGEIEVEAQIFNRRSPLALIAGVDHALAQLRCATGYYDEDRELGGDLARPGSQGRAGWRG